MKRSIIYISSLVFILTSCEPDPNNNPNENHFRMTVNGTELSTLPENVNYLYIANADTMMGIFAAGGTVVYNSLEVNCYQAGTYPITGNQPSGTGGLRYQTIDSLYYIDDTHGSGTVTFETWDISPGTIHELKGTFSGTAATNNGHSVAITNGDFYYHEQ
jgi:hypothetical protein